MSGSVRSRGDERRKSQDGDRYRNLAVSVEQVNLLGVRVTARALLNCAEHERRSSLGLGAVTDPGLLDRLLGLPVRYPCGDPALWAETSAAAPGIVDHGADGCEVTRLLEPPLVVADVIVPAPRGQELGAVQDASLFASFTRRWAQTQGSVIQDTAVLEAKLCGVGLLTCHGRVILPAEPLASATADGWTWLLAEKAYRRWLRQATAARGRLRMATRDPSRLPRCWGLGAMPGRADPPRR